MRLILNPWIDVKHDERLWNYITTTSTTLPPPSLTHTDEMEGGTEITPVKVKEVGQRKGFDD